jgi:hypothetical protein
MRHLKSFYVFLFLQLQISTNGLYGQQLPLQTFSLGADHFEAVDLDGLQMDWRLDLGPTSMMLDQSKSYQFTSGFLQPTINRFTNDEIWEKVNPSIELKNTFSRNVIVLFSKEPDLVLLGFKIFNLNGQVLVSDQTKFRSSYAGRSININAMASGVYIMQVFYLPEQMALDINTNYWMKTLKFIKL